MKTFKSIVAGSAVLAMSAFVATGAVQACEKQANAGDVHAQAQSSKPIVLAEATSHKAGHMSHGGDHAGMAAGLKVEKAWTRVTPPGAKVAGGFVTVTNTGDSEDRLIGGSFDLAGRVEVHEMAVTDGVMRMKQVEGGLKIAPGATVELKPGSYHLMFLDLKASPELGQPVKGVLKFEKAGDVAVSFAVAPLGSKTMDGTSGGGHGSHDMHGSGHNH